MQDPDAGSEYDTISFGDYWGLVSLLFFVGAMTTRMLVRLLPPELRGYGSVPPLAVKVVPVLALIGVVAGLAGMRRSRTKSVAKIGLVLNAVVFVLSLLFVGAFWVWYVYYR